MRRPAGRGRRQRAASATAATAGAVPPASDRTSTCSPATCVTGRHASHRSPSAGADPRQRRPRRGQQRRRAQLDALRRPRGPRRGDDHRRVRVNRLDPSVRQRAARARPSVPPPRRGGTRRGSRRSGRREARVDGQDGRPGAASAASRGAMSRAASPGPPSMTPGGVACYWVGVVTVINLRCRIQWRLRVTDRQVTDWQRSGTGQGLRGHLVRHRGRRRQDHDQPARGAQRVPPDDAVRAVARVQRGPRRPVDRGDHPHGRRGARRSALAVTRRSAATTATSTPAASAG